MILTIRDETGTGKVTNELSLDMLDETITVRELIRSRIYQEVDEHNRRVRTADANGLPFNGLVTPTAVERQLNPSHVGKPIARQIDWQKQFESACLAFERNGFFILIDDGQAENLDDRVTLRATSTISFVKLTPLVGG